MDNKITKKRFADFLSYDWIFITIIILVAIFVWEVIFTFASVKPTVGQKFKILYDEGVESEYEKDIVVVAHDEARAFSFDVLEISKEGLTTGVENEIGVRYKVRDCDVIVTTNVERTAESGAKYTRANYITESFKPWSYEKAVEDGDKYLEKLLKSNLDKITTPGDLTREYTFEQMDLSKIDELFSTRLKGDNRFRKEEQKAQGKLYERIRIEKLCEEVAYAKRLLKDHAELFYTYTLGQQAYDQAVDSGNSANIQTATKKLQEQKSQNLKKYQKEQLSYGIRIDKLQDGEYRPQEFFTSNGKCENLVLMAFDFLEDQPHLQFESLSFMNSIVRLCSDIL